MGKIKDELGHKYGRLTVVAYAGKSKYGAMWHCVCDCGNELDVCGAYLRSHNTMSCGCLQKERAAQSLHDLTGQQFGYLTVIKRDLDKPQGHQKPVFWICKCKCGNITSVRAYSLTSGETKSCGCYRPIQPNFIDETGNKYGLLTVIEQCGVNKDKRVLWRCICECGHEKITTGKSLRAGLVQSCGCLHSKGELQLKTIFKENNINFIPQYYFDDLKSECNYPLYFDFYLPDYNTLIEYQGEQHYHELPLEYFSGSAFEKLQLHDQLKRDYCKNNHIKLIEIPYTDYNKLDYNYIKEVML